MNSQTLHDYLTENHSRGIIDHAIRADVDDKGRVSFYIHPHGHDGNTLDFWVLDDTFWPKGDLTPDEFLQVVKDAAAFVPTAPESVMIPTSERLPEVGVEVVGFSDAWVHADFNPKGMRACFRTDDGWTSAWWHDHQDCYETCSDEAPTHWYAYPACPTS